MRTPKALRPGIERTKEKCPAFFFAPVGATLPMPLLNGWRKRAGSLRRLLSGVGLVKMPGLTIPGTTTMLLFRRAGR